MFLAPLCEPIKKYFSLNQQKISKKFLKYICSYPKNHYFCNPILEKQSKTREYYETYISTIAKKKKKQTRFP